MMKIAVYTPTVSEKKVIDQIAKEEQIEFKLIESDLNGETVDQAQGCDGILLKQQL